MKYETVFRKCIAEPWSTYSMEELSLDQEPTSLLILAIPTLLWEQQAIYGHASVCVYYIYFLQFLLTYFVQGKLNFYCTQSLSCHRLP